MHKMTLEEFRQQKETEMLYDENLNKIKTISIKEFVEKGYLQEVNRQFFHPLGLALECAYYEDLKEWVLHSIWDYRDDPEGMTFGIFDESNIEKAKNVITEQYMKKTVRRLKFGWSEGIQPLQIKTGKNME